MIHDHCVACGNTDTDALHQHHLVPRSLGGSDDPTNLITLCSQCHAKAHRVNATKAEAFTTDDFGKLSHLLESMAKTPNGKMLKNSIAYRAAQAFQKYLSGEVNTLEQAFGLKRAKRGNPNKTRDITLDNFCWEVYKRRELVDPPQSMTEIQTELRKARWRYEIDSNFYTAYNERLPAMRIKAAGMMGFFEPWEEGGDLRLMSVTTADDLVRGGCNLIVVAIVGTNLHIRIFDANGKVVVDKAENELMGGNTLTTLKKKLIPLPDESGLSHKQKQQIIVAAKAIAGYI